MALNPVTLAELLRPWRGAGVTHLLGVEGELSDAFAQAETDLSDAEANAFGTQAGREEGGTPVASGTGNGFAPTAKSASGTVPSSGAAPVSSAQEVERASSAAQPRNVAGQTADAGQRRSVEAPAYPPVAGRAATVPQIALPLDTATWPELWRAAFAKAAPAPLMWVYPELWLDLSGQGSPERSACLRAIIGALRLPRGSSVFWPLRVDAASAAEAAPYFHAGIELLSPKALVLLGRDVPAQAGLDFPSQTVFMQRIVQGRLLVLLPDFTSLLADSALVERSCVYLRSALAGFPSLFAK